MENEQAINKKSMTVREMGKLLGLQKVESYWLVHKGYFETILVCGKMRVVTDSFEDWYRKQFHYKKVDGEPPGSDYDYTMSVAEFADLIGASSGSAYQLIRTQQFHVVKISGHMRLFKPEILGWIDSHPIYQRQTEEVQETKWQNEQRQFILGTPEEDAVTLSKK